MNLDSVFVRYINLDRRPDRNEDTLKKFIDVLGFNKNNIKRFSAIDGLNIVGDLRNKNYIDDELIKILQSTNLNFKTGELGCLLSHYFLLKEISNDLSIPENSYVFVFEDDFFIGTSLKKNNLTDILNKLNKSELANPNLFDMIYFAGRFKQNFIPSKQSLINCFSHSFDNFYLKVKGKGYDWDRTTQSYLVKKNNIKKILNCFLDYFINEPKPIQIDSLYDSLYSKLTMYDYFPHLFYSPVNYSTDIQYCAITINTKEFV